MKRPSFGRRLRLGSFGSAVLSSSFLLTPHLRADEPRRPTEPRILADSATELTQVVDAFDDSNDFDLHLSLAFRQSSRRAAIYRETAGPGLTTNGYVSGDLDVANYVESTNRLIPSIDVGLYRDVALHVRLPIILSNVRRLQDRTGASNSGPSQPGDLELPAALTGLPGEELFSLPFESPTRSGIEYLAIGLDFGIMNQYRSPTRPTWVIGFEGRFNVTEPMRACNTAPGRTTSPNGGEVGQVGCAHPSDVNRDGIVDRGSEARTSTEETFSGTRSPGVSRGTTGLEVHTYVSKRIRYLEPYGGLSGLAEIPTASSDFGSSNLSAAFSNPLPLRGSLVLGTAIVPWEVRESFQRIALDMRFRGTYVSTGRDYSELFDALGSSSAPSLRSPNAASYGGNVDANDSPSANSNVGRVYFTGITEVQRHTEYELSAQFTWQAGEYVRFDLGGAWRIVQGHIITFDRACQARSPESAAAAGPCQQNLGTEDVPDWSPTGTPNPHHRGVINAPGNRFRVGTSHGIDAWLRASVMF